MSGSRLREPTDEEDEESAPVCGDDVLPCGIFSQGSNFYEDWRTVNFGRKVLVDEAIAATEDEPLPGNKVKTSKYTVLNFLCKNTYEQMQRMANVWFIFLSFLMYLGYYPIKDSKIFPGLINPWPTLGTLLLMMMITAISNALDDISRCQADKEMNEQTCQIASSGSSWREEKRWQELNVGDILIIQNMEQIPADVVCLASSGDEGLSFVSTANLDGETNLKNKHAVEATQEAFCGKSHGSLEQAVTKLLNSEGSVEAEPPGWDVNSFNGKISFKVGDNWVLKPLGAEQLLLRGTVLRNTPWCIGLVVYTGEQTRMMKNSRPTPLKSPTLDILINKAVGIIIVIQALMALISTVLRERSESEFSSYWYLQPQTTMLLPTAIGNWLAFFLLYSNLVPVSLFATIEACNFFQSKFINNDRKMFDPTINMASQARSRNLCQEPGQINYIFSDKTGTLTQNVMDLKQLSIGGKIYGTVDSKKGFSGGEALKQAQTGQQKEAIQGFLEVLGVAHTVIVDHSGNYEAESPDEAALVEAVAKLGYAMKDRKGHDMHVQVGDKLTTYTVLAINGFTSGRARMSSLVKNNDTGEYTLLAKGADTKMLERARGNHEALIEDLHTFSCEGLRTLVLGRRKLGASEATSLVQEYEQAHLAPDKDSALAAVAEKMEQNLEILGATAIEDKLQEGVGETIEMIRRAGIFLWVLTGDKLETARNIGFSCKVLSKSMDILIFDKLDSEDTLQGLIDQATQNAEKGVTTAMMCTGSALKTVMEEETYVQMFLELAKCCSVVIACRVAPLQKAEMVNIVSKGVKTADGKDPITLAIGDGANDVPMIQAAKVGVGIYGKEGRQAVNNSDFAIGQFRFLANLLFIHGRTNYIRAAKVILFTFWRNAVLVLSMFYYTFSTGNTGVPLFEDIVRGTFNVVTFIPTVATGIMDRDFPAKIIMQTPEMYETGRDGKKFNVVTILETMLSAFIHSLLLLTIMRVSYEGLDMSNIGDVYTYGTTVFTCLMVAVVYRLIHITEAWNWIFWLSVVVGCFLFYVFCLSVTSLVNMPMLNFPQMYMVAFMMVSKPLFWVCLFTVPALAMTMDLFKKYLWTSCPCLAENEHIDEALKAAKEAEMEKEPESERVLQAKRSSDYVTSYDMNHPGIHRHPSTMKRPSDETMKHLDSQGVGELTEGETSDSYSRISIDDEEDPPAGSTIAENAFIQQEVPVCWNCMSKNAPPPCNPCVCAASCSFLMSLILILFGCIILSNADYVNQARIHYDGGHERSMFSDISPSHEVTTTSCPVGSPTCRVTLQISKDMQPPILVFYQLFPFYQNFFDYYNSIYWPELLGKPVEDYDSKLYKSKCAKQVRETPGGERISPCGMQAQAIFNDTFRIEGITLDETNIAWASDLRRIKNPPDYNLSSASSPGWLSHRFPSIVNKSTGIAKNERFAAWVRPDAYAEVRKPYAHINVPLYAGQNITVLIDAHYPVSAGDMRKELVLTTLSPFGGRDKTFAWFLLITGAMCMVTSILICVVEVILKTYFAPDDEDEDFESEYSRHTTDDDLDQE